jgi:uncharacterized protein
MSKSSTTGSKAGAGIAGTLIPVDRFTRLKERLEGVIAPTDLPELTDFLAGPAGEIRYRISGNVLTDQLSSQKRQLKCIILGWFEVADPHTLLPDRFELDIESKLIVVSSESDLPPLEAEQDDEDYIVAGAEISVLDVVQEEVLLALPADLPRRTAEDIRVSAQEKLLAAKQSAPKAESMTQKPSPFAKLAALKVQKTQK